MGSFPKAIINLESKVVFPTVSNGTPQEILYTEGAFIVHADLRGSQWGYVVTAPCGYALGLYRLKGNARKAAKALNPLVVDKDGDTLETIFAGKEGARLAYDAVREYFK